MRHDTTQMEVHMVVGVCIVILFVLFYIIFFESQSTLALYSSSQVKTCFQSIINLFAHILYSK